MANVLDLLWDLVERPNERAEYLEDPTGYVRSRGRGDLTGEDVKAALDLVADLVPADFAAAIHGRLQAAASPALLGDESPLDGALRSLSQVVDSLDGFGEAGPRPDPNDTTLAVQAPPAPAGEAVEPETPDPATPDPRLDLSADEVDFDPSALHVEGDAPPANEVVVPLPDQVEEAPFDRSAILSAADGEPDTGEVDISDAGIDDADEVAEVVTLSWDDEPASPPADPSTEHTSAGAYAFGPGSAASDADQPDEPFEAPAVAAGGFGAGAASGDPADADDDADADESPEPQSLVSPSETTLFKKKSNLTLPTLGIDSADWYEDAEAPEDS